MKPVSRVVSLAPQFTEALFELGRGEVIVGVSASESYPPEATALPVVVGSDGLSPDVEAVKRTGTDAVLAAGMAGAPWKSELRAAGILVVTLDARSFDDALRDMIVVGRLIGRTDAAEQLAERLHRQARAVSASVDGKQPPLVFFETFFSPLIGAGPNTYIGDLLEIAGGRAVTTPDGGYSEFSIDQVAAADPDVYVAPLTSGESVDAVRARPGFETLRAVAQERVYVLDDALLFRPGPRIAQGLRALARALHPS